MPAFDTKTAALQIRNLITERSPARSDVTLPHIQALIPTALELWVRAVANDPEKAPRLSQTQELGFAAGTCDLTNLDVDISYADLRNSPVYMTIAGVRTPFTWVASMAQLNVTRRFASSAPAVFLEGDILYSRNTDGSTGTLSGVAETNVITYPATTIDIPPTLTGDFVSFAANMAIKEKLVGS